MCNFNSELQLQCTECGYRWWMKAVSYYHGDFIIRKCPRCNFIDARNSLKPQQLGKHATSGIYVIATDY